MNICFTICALSNSGGTERVSTLIANELSNRGYHVFFVSYVGESKPFFQLDNRITFYRILRNKWEHKMRHIPGYVQWRYQMFLRKNKVDVVIDVDTLMAELSAEACYKTGVKLISWDHFNYTYMQGTERKKNLLRLINQYSSQLVVLTKADKQMYLENTDFSSGFITQIYNPRSFDIKEVVHHSEKKVLAVGRFMPQKGFDTLLKIWAIVEPQMPEWELEIIGDDGKDEVELHQQKENLGLHNVKLLPATKNIMEHYRKASIYTLSSRFEGFPMVLLEATGMGLPIVAFNCKTGPDEIIENGENGFLINPDDINEFANKLLLLMRDETLRKRLGKRSFEMSQKFSMQEIGDAWQQLIERILKNEKTGNE